MDSTTQQNAALVEQAAAVAQTLTEQATLLQSSISTFRLQTAPVEAQSSGVIAWNRSKTSPGLVTSS
jgi:methyl-accepting chemotaxis protein